MKSLNENVKIGTCPFCGKHESFAFKEAETWMFLCHDCQRYMTYEKTGLGKQHAQSISHSTSSGLDYSNLLSYATLVDQLGSTNAFRQYCNKRRIPLDRVYATDQFDRISEFAGTPVKDKERLLLPFYTKEGKLFGVQGRSLDPKQVRYITLMFDKDHPKIFGLERIDETKDIVIVEGPIDSFFVNNCLAMAGSDGIPNKYKTNAIVAYDNEPRSKQTVAKIHKSLKEGYRVVIWPDSLKFKDINDMVLNGIDVNDIIMNNIYSGLSGLLKLNTWKK